MAKVDNVTKLDIPKTIWFAGKRRRVKQLSPNIWRFRTGSNYMVIDVSYNEIDNKFTTYARLDYENNTSHVDGVYYVISDSFLRAVYDIELILMRAINLMTKSIRG
jgi:hypothetical protein